MKRGQGDSQRNVRQWVTGDGGEVVWTAALALLFVTVGYTLLPGLIRMAGKTGRIESVEWALFLLLGSAYPVAAAASSWILVRSSARRASIADAIAWAVIAILALRFFVIHGKIGRASSREKVERARGAGTVKRNT